MLASALAALAATAICVAQRHVHLVLTEPRTYASPLRHKCGLLMIACVTWALLELRSYSAAMRLRTKQTR
jgi:hypothetical protein